MNEVTRIHLGRQSYTISVEAHKLLKEYLASIQKKVADTDVANEVELRMSELLTERGVSGDKVVLAADVNYLKQQLGDPVDFSDDTDDTPEAPSVSKTTKRLFRDTDNALVAGVAAGVANFTGLDAVLIRLIFVLLTIFSGGLGIVLYLLMWLIVPPAETASEKLQMSGKPVTLEALKDTVGKADVAGAARRANNAILPVINGIFRVGVKLIGIGLIVAGISTLVGIAVTKMYMLLHEGRLFQENLFPVGIREEWLVALAMIMGVIVSIFLILTGVAAFKHKWPIRGWITGVLAGLLVLGTAASFALAADAAPRVRDRYETSLHTTAVQNIAPFSKVVSSGEIDIAYVSSPNYAVNLHYSDHPDLSKVKIFVKNDTLYIDSKMLDEQPSHCTMLCLFPRYNMTVQVYSPNVTQFVKPDSTEIFYPSPAELN